MKEKYLFSYYIKYSIVCAVAYCIPVFFFFRTDTFSGAWLLYLGNTFYITLLLISGLFVNKKLNDYASLRSMIMAGVKVIVSSILIICVITTIMLLAYNRNSTVPLAPDKTDSLIYMLLMDAVFVNFIIGMMGVCIGAVVI